MNVDMKHHRHFVATRGKILRNIADEFGGVTISFPRSGVKSEKVVIKGSKDCVEAAKKKIADIVDDLVSCVMLTCLELRIYVAWLWDFVHYVAAKLEKKNTKYKFNLQNYGNVRRSKKFFDKVSAFSRKF